jgi:predicted secreted protein
VSVAIRGAQWSVGVGCAVLLLSPLSARAQGVARLEPVQPPGAAQAPAAQGPDLSALQGLLRMYMLASPPVLALEGDDVRIVTARGVYRLDRETLEMRSAEEYGPPGGGPPWPATLYDYTTADLRATRPLTVRVGATVVLSLESNPTTGYDWAIEGIDETTCTLTYDGYFAAPAPPGMVGTGGTHLFEIFGLSPGELDLTFAYRRPWVGGETAEEHAVHLKVVGPEAPPAAPVQPAEG